MDVIGIVCEYNPFHMGHLHQLNESRRLLGNDTAVVCAMSGDFIQRGEAAVYSKFARAEAACRCGADLVVELPLPWCLSSAEGFARGAVSLLGNLGVTHLSFGSESGDLPALLTLAKSLSDPAWIEEIKALLSFDPSLSFAAARQIAAEQHLGPLGKLLSRPNDILAVEYLKAIYSLQLKMAPLAITRIGAGHDSMDTTSDLRSASQLRAILREGGRIDEYTPPLAAMICRRERELGRELSSPLLLETALLSRLRLFDEDHFLTLPDCADGLGSRIYQALRCESSLEAVFQSAKTKRYALSRVRRAVLCAALGVKAGMADETPPYARVLAANSRGRGLLRQLSENSGVPLLTKPAAVRSLSENCQKIFSLGASAHDLYVLGYNPMAERACGQDWRTGPVIIDR